MPQLKDRIKTQTEQSPNLTAGMSFKKVISCEFRDTQYKKANGSMQQVCIMTTDPNGNGNTVKYHTTASAIVDVMYEYFVTDKGIEPLENVRVVELRSKQGRMYLSVEGF